ncbi:MAG TPA: hypothetical protein VGB54_00815 [Allosphingosinicella sp.]
MVVSPVPALMMQARRKVVGHLSGVGATSAGSAVSYIPTRKMERSALTYLQRKGVVSLAQGGRYWVDETKAADLQRSTRTRIAVIAGGALAAVAAVFAFTR